MELELGFSFFKNPIRDFGEVYFLEMKGTED
jgi:hypothetical protein